MSEKDSILVIDDEESMRNLLSDVLGEEYAVLTAPDGKAGISRLKEVDFSAAVVDIKMPGMDGLQVLRYIKETSPEVEVVMLTAYASLGSAVEAVKLGAYDYLTKPFKGAEIKKVLANAIRKQKLVVENRGLLQDLKRTNEQLNQELAERKRAEERIEASLKEKEVLLKEIHHRVKNNLQIISSLLSLQSMHVKDKGAVEMFKDSQSRVRSMALIHEKLYKSEGLVKINLAEYIRDLSSYLLRSYETKPDAIRLELSADDVLMSIDTAIPCGLILNELISNSLKHAFSGRKGGEIRIGFHSDNEDRSVLTVGDNGIGFPEDLDPRSTKSLGLQLVNALTDQLGGSIELDRRGGTEFKVAFAEPKY